VEVAYVINEGRPFLLGRVIVKGNDRTQDKVVLREVRVEPGQLYNSYEIQRAQERIRATNLFSAVTITPIGEDPEYRDLLVEVQETQTARFLIGAAVTSNSGVLGNISYEQRNFDIGAWAKNPTDLFSNRVTGAGQTFRLQLEPGTELSRARVDFIEPWVFDKPYSLGVSAYLSQRLREDWTESRLGGRVSIGKRFDDVWSARVSVRAEDVTIEDIEDEGERAAEVLLAEGHNFLDSVGLEIRRDTTDSPILPSRGTVTTAGWERYGLFGDFDFDKFTAGWNWYTTVYEDLLDRKTILSIRTDAGYITGDAPFFERFYGGGLGSVRGFRYRGISPRAGIDEDPIGGGFSLTGTVEVNFPIAGDALRGVIFTDAGTVEEDLEIDTIRVSAGFGLRLTLPFFGQVPIALDFGFPLNEDEQDETRVFSFSLGLMQ
jgi:outer membrane protein assembly complex protein YaeT